MIILSMIVINKHPYKFANHEDARAIYLLFPAHLTKNYLISLLHIV